MTQKRTCGGCTACCWTHYIPELEKPMHTGCAHQTVQGCSIYGKHPFSCRQYSCGWRNGLGRDRHRPDRSGIVVDVSDHRGHMRITLVEVKPGALQSRTGRALLKLYQRERFRFYTMSHDGICTKYVPRGQAEFQDLLGELLGSKRARANEVVYA